MYRIQQWYQSHGFIERIKRLKNDCGIYMKFWKFYCMVQWWFDIMVIIYVLHLILVIDAKKNWLCMKNQSRNFLYRGMQRPWPSDHSGVASHKSRKFLDRGIHRPWPSDHSGVASYQSWEFLSRGVQRPWPPGHSGIAPIWTCTVFFFKCVLMRLDI